MSVARLPQVLSFLGAARVALIRGALDRPAPAGDTLGLEIRRVLAAFDPLPPAMGAFKRSAHPVTRLLGDIAWSGTAETAPLLRALQPVVRFLPWRYNYAARADAPDLARNIAFAEIIGPAAPLRSDFVCLGLTLIAPWTLYPSHRHPAIELYHVLSGTATWTLNGVARDNPPGAFILHPSLAVHAMETHDEPLLALYTWSGADVHTPSVYVPSPLSTTNP